MQPTDHGLLIPDQGNTMEYYSAPKKNEIMPFETTWMNLEMVMPNELSQTGEIPCDIPYMQNLNRSVTNALTKQKQIHRGEEWGKGQGVWDQHVHTIVFEMNNQ